MATKPLNAAWSVRQAIEWLERDIEKLPLSPTVRLQFRQLKEAADSDKTTLIEIKTLLQAFETSLHADLGQHTYLLVPSSRAIYYDTPDLFGPDVADKFDKATDDIAAAGRCIALEEWTAAVFHLMRAAELAVQRLADDLGITNVEWSDWGYLLKHIDGALKTMENEPRSLQRDKRIEYYSRARNDFAAFNSAWRKHVMHPRDPYGYGERQSMQIYVAVRSLMTQLASESPS